jgi:SH3 domain-containing YSC84-like protein 1
VVEFAESERLGHDLQHLAKTVGRIQINLSDELINSIEEVKEMRMNRQLRSSYSWTVMLAVLLGLMPAFARAADADMDERITASGNVLKELLGSDHGIPLSVLNKAECVIVLPSVKKGGFIIAAQYGRGVMTCRGGKNFDGTWGAPVMMQSSGGSFGLQAGGQSTDFVILVMNDKGARAVAHGKAKLGADASVAAGPVGRDAEASTNAGMGAQMLSYSRSQGVFGGLSLSGTSLGPDGGANEKVYGKKISGDEIISGSVQPPASASDLLSILKEKSPTNQSGGK